MDGLIVIVVVVLLIVGAVILWPRLMGGASTAGRASPVPAPAPAPRPDDPDQVDEAGHVVSAVGGQVRPGDAVTVHIHDPEPWGLTSFDLDLSVTAVSRAEIRDATGLFTFMVYWMSPGQEADLLMVEGDVLALAEVFVGTRLTNADLSQAVQWCRDQYKADPRDEVEFDLSELGFGTWTAFSAREGGAIRLDSGTAPLLPAGAAGPNGVSYRDFTLYQGSRQEPHRLRLVEIGAYPYLFKGEVVALDEVKFLRRTSPGAR
jgi:hypothetical protein